MKKLMAVLLVAVSLFSFQSISRQKSIPMEKGIVVKAYTQRGYGRMGYEWLFMDIKTKDGRIVHVAIAPTFRIGNLPINEGDVVEVDGFTPSTFPKGVIKAVNIYDVTQKREFPISRWGRYGYAY